MKRTLAITTAAMLLAISLTACGAEGGMPDTGTIAGGTTATDTMRTDRMPGTGTTGGATANARGDGTTGSAAANARGDGTMDSAAVDTSHGDGTMPDRATDVNGANSVMGDTAASTPGGLGSVAGAARYGMTGRDGSVYGVGGPNSSVYTATNNGGVVSSARSYENDFEVARAAAEGDRYARMLENARVHDHDGFLFDGENTSYDTF